MRVPRATTRYPPAPHPYRSCLPETLLRECVRRRTAPREQRQSEWWYLRCRARSHETNSWRHCSCARQMCHPKADGKKAFINTTLGVLCRTTSSVLKQTDRSDATICAEVEPVPCAAWYADQITGFDLDCQHRSRCRMNVK